MAFEDDLDEMAPEQRIAEVATFLAAAWLRMRQRPAMLAAATDNPAPFTDKPLDSEAEPTPLCDHGPARRGRTPAEDAA